MNDSAAEKAELITVLNELYSSGLITSTGGNISFRSPEDSGRIWIMPGGVHKGSLTTEMLVEVDLEGRVSRKSAYPPSSERHVHCAVYRARPDIHAVIHSHAPQISVLSLAGVPFLPISTGAAIVGEIPRVSFLLPGTTELAEAVADALGDAGVSVMMQNHGLVVVASTLRRAADLTCVIERTAEEILGCLAVGRVPPVLEEAELATIRGWRGSHL
jgi:autoinducer 2 (AI-2) kinase